MYFRASIHLETLQKLKAIIVCVHILIIQKYDTRGIPSYDSVSFPNATTVNFSQNILELLAPLNLSKAPCFS